MIDLQDTISIRKHLYLLGAIKKTRDRKLVNTLIDYWENKLITSKIR